MSQHPEDEFDIAARERGPRGVHRRVQGRFRRVVPYLVVLVAAPLLAWGAISLLNQNEQPTPSASGEAASVETAAPTAAPTTPAPTPTPTPEPTPEPTTAAPEPILATPISVLNGANRPGVAARIADRLGEAGFTSIVADNYVSPQPTVSTVYYESPELAATAQAIADELGIGPVTQLASASNSIVVVIRSDFQE